MHEEDAVVGEDFVEAVADGDDGAFFEFFFDHFFDVLGGFEVDVRGGFVHDYDFVSAEDCLDD